MQHSSQDSVVQKYGSYTNFYRQVAKETGTTPDQVMEQAENMMNPGMQQNSLGGANAQTPVSQVANGPVPVSPPAVQAQSQALQSQGMGPSQAQNQAAVNPANQMNMAKGGTVANPPSKPEIDAKLAASSPPSKDLMAAALGTTSNAVKPAPTKQAAQSKPAVDPGLQQFDDALQTLQIEKNAKAPQMAKGGTVGGKAGDLKLKEILQLLATHPDMAGQGQPSTGMKGVNMSFGGGVNANTDPDLKGSTNGKSFGPTQQEGLISGYAKGGKINTSTEVEGEDSGMSIDKLDLADGGMLESDQITGYGPDGQPIIQNPDGTTGYGDTNQLLGRPENSPTLGTGEDPSNSQSRNAANAPMLGMAMAKGGESDAPPGALSAEVADNVPAHLSEGEFVMNAVSTRFWGLQKLTMMQEYAASETDKMSQSGQIRSLGDGMNPQQGGFMQDGQPNNKFFSPQDKGQGPDEDDMPPMDGKNRGGLIKMSMGGGTSEETQFAKGGTVDGMQYGRNNMVSSHPKGGSVHQDYDKGGIVSSKSKDLSPMKGTITVPTSGVKLPKPKATINGPHSDSTMYGNGKFAIKANKGGLLRNVNQTESYIG